MKLVILALLIRPILPSEWKIPFLFDYMESFEGHFITLIISNPDWSLYRKKLLQVTEN